MSKRILSLMLCFVMVLTTIMVVPVGAVTYLQTKISVVPDKTTAAPGDVINYTVVMGPVSDLGSLQMELVIPEGLTYKPGTGKITDGLMEAMGFDALDWTEESLIINGGASAADYNSDRSTILGTFSCTVNEGFYGTAAVDLTYLEFYSCQTWDDHTERFSVVTTPITVDPPVPEFATEVVYSGVKLDATNRYLYSLTAMTGSMQLQASSSPTAPEGYTLFAEFDPDTATLTMKRTYNIDGWNSMNDAKVLPGATDNKLYGIWANGDFTLDIGDTSNFINLEWRHPNGDESYSGIYTAGDFTLKGTTGRFKIAAHPSRSEANPISYGINAGGSVNLEGGVLEIFAKPYGDMLEGGKAVFINANDKINLKGAAVRFRGEKIRTDYIQHFGKTPNLADGYLVEENLDLEMSGDSLGNVTEVADYDNPAMANYAPTSVITFVTNGGSAIDPITVLNASTIDLSLYEPTKDGFNFAGWYRDEELSVKVTSLFVDGNTTLYAKWRSSEPSAPATEVIYAGAKLDATNKYLFYKIEGGVVQTTASAEDLTAAGLKLLAEFDASIGKLTMKNGFYINGWNSYSEAKKLDGGNIYYGIKANGSLTIDVGAFDNTLNLNWNYPDNGDTMENIYVDGTLTIDGTTGILRVCANPSMNTGSGDYMSYGIKAEEDINFIGGTVELYTKPVHLKTVNQGSKVTQVASMSGNINMNGGAVQFVADKGRTYVIKMNKAPRLADGYTQPDVSTLVPNGSIGWTQTDPSGGNTNAARYAPSVSIVFDTAGGSVIDPLPVGAGTKVMLDGYVPTKPGYKFIGWFDTPDYYTRINSITPAKVTTIYAKWVEENTTGYATEVYYAGAKLDATNKYLFYKVEGGAVKTASGSEKALAGYLPYGEFNPAKGRLTLTAGFNIDGWNSYSEAARVHGKYHGIWANGNFTLDIGDTKNTINLNWNYPTDTVLENIYVDGDFTLRGGSGILRLCANPTIANPGDFMAYGIKAEGNIYLKGGSLEVYNKHLYLSEVRGNSKTTLLGAINGNIYFDGANVQLLSLKTYTYVTLTNKKPIVSAGYQKLDATTLVLDGSIGWWKNDDSGNNNAMKYQAPTKKTIYVGGVALDVDNPYLVPNGMGWAKAEEDDGTAVAHLDLANFVLEFTKDATIYGVHTSVEKGGLNTYNCIGSVDSYEIKVNEGVTVNLHAPSELDVARAVWGNGDLKISGKGKLNISAGPAKANSNNASGGIWSDGKLTIDGVTVAVRTVGDKVDGRTGYAIYGAKGVDISGGATVVAGTELGKLINVAPTIYTGAAASMAESASCEYDVPSAASELVKFNAGTVKDMKFLSVKPDGMTLVSFAGYGQNGAVLASDPVVEFVFNSAITGEVSTANVSGVNVASVAKDGNVLKVTLVNATPGAEYSITLSGINGVNGTYSGTVAVKAATTDITGVTFDGTNNVSVSVNAGTSSQKVLVIAVVWEDASAKTAKKVKSVQQTVSGTGTVTINSLGAKAGDVVEVMIWDGASSRKILNKSVVFGN